MINKWLITGDTHGKVNQRLSYIVENQEIENPEETALIILGDAGFNFYLNEKDSKLKHNVESFKMWIYCVRGNHEERPENLNYSLIYDANVEGLVYIDPIVSKIRYFVDGEVYNINGYSVLVIGGAYSVDKWYRLEGLNENTNKWTGWFKDEQLNTNERLTIGYHTKNKNYDFVFSHTCPISWEPSDLFLNGLDQSTVDKTMEIWLDYLKDNFNWNIWLFGHYHADRLERPHVEQFFTDVEDLTTIWNRWNSNNEPEWWLTKSPNYYIE